jgi:hypothetical protein
MGPISPAEFATKAIKTRMSKAELKDSGDNSDDDTPTYSTYAEDTNGEEQIVPESNNFMLDAFDKYIGAQLDLPLHDAMASATIVARKRDHGGNPIGNSNSNPLLDTRVYKVKLPDGSSKEYAANIIGAKNMYAQVNDKGQQYKIMEELVDHRKGADATPDDQAYVTINGRCHPKQMTKVWQLCVQWRDGSTSWEDLKNLKEANPIKTAEYAMANSLTSEPAFS